MAISRNQSSNSIIATIINSATAEINYAYSNDNEIIFDKGRGQSLFNSPGYGVDYGEWFLFPSSDFKANVKMWGGGGGAHGSAGDAPAGGGGHTVGNVNFMKNIPYVIWVGESGFHNHHSFDTNGNRYRPRVGCAFGGGTGGGHVGGTGGGLSGLFFDCAPTNGGPGAFCQHLGTTFRSPGQSTALLIAGGGGGSGHHTQTNHGRGGGGGGDTAEVSHAQSPANQHGAGHYWNSGTTGQTGWPLQGGLGGATSYTGGGGGGWYGGPGGSHSGSQYNGGGGGSGHIITNTQSGYPNFWIRQLYPNIVSNASTTTAPGSHSVNNPAPAGITDSDYINYTGYGGGSSSTFTPTVSSGNNGRVLIRFRGFGNL